MATISRDIYKNDIDFTALALHYPDFAKRLKPNRQLDFTDPESVRQLTKSLLHRDFNIELKIPDDRLCPPVPNRLNYIFWLQDLLDSTSASYRETFDPARQVTGLDMYVPLCNLGTGASCIYPLLGCRKRSQWRFLATEIDSRSRDYAQQNIEANDLTSHIKLLSSHVTAQNLLPTQELSAYGNIDFVMTNPPFYASESEMLESAKMKRRPPNSACTGAPVEMITKGGEVEFASQLILESLQPGNKDLIQWFTSMLGKLSSVSIVVERLREKRCNNYAVTEFIQGQKTRRWAVAWSWRNLRPTVDVARGIPGFEKKLLPFPSDFNFVVDGTEMQSVGAKVDSHIKELDLQWQWKAAAGVGMGMAKQDMWSRKARRRKKQEDEDHEMNNVESDHEEAPALVFKVSVAHEEHEASGCIVKIRWVQGEDSVLFESFCGWLKRKVEAGQRVDLASSGFTFHSERPV